MVEGVTCGRGGHMVEGVTCGRGGHPQVYAAYGSPRPSPPLPHLLALIPLTLLCVVASHSPFLRSKKTLWASEPPYCRLIVLPIISYMDMRMKDRLLSEGRVRGRCEEGGCI